MNNQNERIKMFVVILMIAACILLIFGLTSFSYYMSQTIDAPTEDVESARFLINDGSQVVGLSSYTIIVDKETGVQYLVVSYGTDSEMMTVLMNPDGTPIMTVE